MRIKSLGLAALIATGCAPSNESPETILPPNRYQYAVSVVPTVIERDPNAILEAPLEKAVVAMEEVIKPDAYIIDFSGSMDDKALNSNKSKLQIAKEHAYRAGSRVYACGADIGRYRDGASIDTMSSAGGTPLRQCEGSILTDSLNKFETLFSLTDGKDTEGGYTPEVLAKLAKDKGVCFVYLMIGQIDKDAIEVMDYLNKETCADPKKRNRAVNN